MAAKDSTADDAVVVQNVGGQNGDKENGCSGGDFFRDILGSPRFVVAPMVDASELAWRMLSKLCRIYRYLCTGTGIQHYLCRYRYVAPNKGQIY